MEFGTTDDTDWWLTKRVDKVAKYVGWWNGFLSIFIESYILFI